MKVVVTPDPPKPLAVTPNYLYKLNYDFEYESEGSLQFDVGSILDKAGTNSRIENGNIAVAYTVWSRKRGAGREIINKLAEWAKKHHCERLVTLSPLTPMATHFHITNGAKQIKVSEETQNFEYKLYEKNKTK